MSDYGASFSGSSSSSLGMNSPFVLTTGGSGSKTDNTTPLLILGGFLLAGLALFWFLFKKH
jgi:LPXTG-motif cell wall-anchored protein